MLNNLDPCLVVAVEGEFEAVGTELAPSDANCPCVALRLCLKFLYWISEIIGKSLLFTGFGFRLITHYLFTVRHRQIVVSVPLSP